MDWEPELPWYGRLYSALVTFSVGVIFGCAIWACLGVVTGHHEPWNVAGLHYHVFLFVAGVLVGWVCPGYFHVGVVGIFAGQILYVYLAEHSTPMVLTVLAVLLLGTWPALLGAALPFSIALWHRRASHR